MVDRLETALRGEEISPRSNSCCPLVFHSPSTILYLTHPEAHRLLDELDMALDHPEGDVIVVADAEMRVDEASELSGRLQRSLTPVHDWKRYGF